MNGVRYSIVALAPQDWDAQWVNRQQLLSRIGRWHDVLYSTGGWFLWDRASPEWKQARLFGDLRRADNVCIDLSPRLLMRWPRVVPVDRAVMGMQARRWSRWCKSRPGQPIVAHVCHPRFEPYVGMLDADRLVYHVYDQYDRMPGWNDEWERAERRLLKEAHLVFCVSEQIAQALRAKVQRNVRVLTNGADVEAFAAARTLAPGIPADLARIRGPRIGWTGSVHPEIDYGLVATLAKRRPEWSFVFVGNKVHFDDRRIEQEYRACAAIPNVHFLGYKHRAEVPAYVCSMDVNMMCYRLSDDRWIKVGYPLKLHEYLAAGKPVVSAELEVIKAHADVIRFASGADAWEEAIEEGLERGGAGTPELRLAAARQHSWDAKAAQLNRWLCAMEDEVAEVRRGARARPASMRLS